MHHGQTANAAQAFNEKLSAAQAAGYNQATVSRPSPEIDGIKNRLSIFLDQLGNFACRLADVSERLTGPVTMGNDKVCEPRQPATGHMALLSNAVDEAFARLSRAEQILNNISSAI